MWLRFRLPLSPIIPDTRPKKFPETNAHACRASRGVREHFLSPSKGPPPLLRVAHKRGGGCSWPSGQLQPEGVFGGRQPSHKPRLEAAWLAGIELETLTVT